MGHCKCTGMGSCAIGTQAETGFTFVSKQPTRRLHMQATTTSLPYRNYSDEQHCSIACGQAGIARHSRQTHLYACSIIPKDNKLHSWANCLVMGTCLSPNHNPEAEGAKGLLGLYHIDTVEVMLDNLYCYMQTCFTKI